MRPMGSHDAASARRTRRTACFASRAAFTALPIASGYAMLLDARSTELCAVVSETMRPQHVSLRSRVR